jgi:hypothetical protein
MSTHSSISSRKRDAADEIYTFPYQVRSSTLSIDNSVVMVEYQDDEQALIIAGNLPGLTGYFDNYPEVEGEEKQRRHDFAKTQLERAKNHLDDYDPEESTSKSNSGNRHMQDLYVTVDREERDQVVFKMWQMLNEMKEQYIEFLQESDEEEYLDYPQLQNEIVEVSKRVDIID